MRFTLVLLLSVSPLVSAAAVAGSFDKDVQPLLRQTCSGCHNEKLASGGLNLTPFMEASSVIAKRDGWEQIVAKLKTGEMPPEGIPRPPAEKMDALLKFVQDQFDRADKNAKVDPG